MSNRYVRTGDSIQHTPAAAVGNGDVIVVGTLLGVSQQAIAAAATGTVAIARCHSLPKVANAAIAQGAMLYADISDSNKLNADGAAAVGDLENCAVALSAAPANSDTVEALLLPGRGAVKA